ncbi:MAG: D-cysteine desulfhydrase family protein [Pseudomonadales bacterium]
MPLDWLNTLPRQLLGLLPTPLQPLDRLSAELGGPRVWVKRDDCTGLATGGNKTRKLEYLLGAASAAGADTVITFGAVQSNHARQTAAACAVAGMECHLLLARKVPWDDVNYEHLGNPQLDRLLGASVHLVDAREFNSRYAALRAELEARSRRVYVIPTGGSNATGALGYAACAAELIDQASALEELQLTDIAHASSSAGTQAGLIAGFAALKPSPDIRVHGINVSEPDQQSLFDAVQKIASELLQTHQPGTQLDPGQILIDSRYLGEGYGLPTRLTVEAIRKVAACEGLLMDPVYSGKAMGGLIDRIRRGEFDTVQDLVFIHTGGSAALPVYGSVL